MAGEIDKIKSSVEVVPFLSDTSKFADTLETETSNAIKEGVEEGFSKLPQSSFDILNKKVTLLQTKLKGLLRGDDNKAVKEQEKVVNTQEKLLSAQKKLAEISKGTALSEMLGGLYSKDELSKQNIYSEKQSLIQDKLKQGNLTVENTLRLYEQLVNLKQKEADIEKRNKAESEKRHQQEAKAQEGLLSAQKKDARGANITAQYGNFQRLISRFGNIAIYRLIRTALKEISDAFSESINKIALLSPEFNKTLSSITSSVNVLKSSIGVGLYQSIILVEPILTGFTTLFAQIGNSISLTTAALRGQSTYLKVNLDYWQDYQDTLNGALLSFDTFTTLSDDSKFGIIIESNVAEETSKLVTDWTAVAAIVALVVNSASPLSQIIGKAVSKSSTLSSLFGKTKDSAQDLDLNIQSSTSSTSSLKDKLSGAATVVAGLYETFDGIKKIQQWDEMSGWKKFLSILEVIAGVASVVAGMLAFASNPTLVGVGKVVGAISTITGLGAIVLSSVQAFDSGGMFEGAGTMYALAGENGAEVVAKGTSGTGVTNVEQFADAMYLALVRYGAAKGEDMTVNIGADNVSSLGTAIARSDGFIREVNRKNPAIRLK